jgi:small subunit ribosomal protein S2
MSKLNNTNFTEIGPSYNKLLTATPLAFNQIEQNLEETSLNILNDLMKTKAHLGTLKWTKMMSPFLFGYRNNISIFNLEHTIICIKQTLKILQNIKQKNGHILFVNTSQKYSELVKITAQITKHSYINDRWIGGTLTNWKQLSNSIFLFQKFANQFDLFLKKNNIQITNYIKAKKRYEGLRTRSDGFAIGVAVVSPSYLPDIIILTNPEKNSIVIQEAQKFQIPIISFVDSNMPLVDNMNIQYLIPGNNQSISFMYFCFNLFTIILKKN